MLFITTLVIYTRLEQIIVNHVVYVPYLQESWLVILHDIFLKFEAAAVKILSEINRTTLSMFEHESPLMFFVYYISMLLQQNSCLSQAYNRNNVLVTLTNSDSITNNVQNQENTNSKLRKYAGFWRQTFSGI